MNEKFGYIIAFILITISAISFRSAAVDGFIPSMYYGTSPVAWITLIGSFGMFSFVLYEYSNYRPLGFVGLLLPPVTLISVPRIRTGFPYGREDILSQIGHSVEIRWNDSFEPETLGYPFMHIHLHILDAVTGTGLDFLYSIYIPLLYLLYVIMVGVTARVLFRKYIFIYTTILFSCLVLFGGYTTQAFPNAVGLYISMLIIHTMILLIKTMNWGFFILFTLGIFAGIIAHPLTTVLLLNVFIFSAIVTYLLPHSKKTIDTPLFHTSKKVYGLGIFILSISFVEWTATTGLGDRSIERAFLFALGIEVPVRSPSGSQAVLLDTTELVELFAILYGGRSVVALLTMSGVFISLYFWHIKNQTQLNIWVAIPLLGWLIVNGVHLIAGYAIPQAGLPGGRLVFTIYLTAPFFAAYALVFITNIPKLQGKQLLVLILVITLLFGMQAVAIYGNDRTTGSNQQQTEHEFSGTEWLLDYKDQDTPKTEFSTHRYERAIEGNQNIRGERLDEFPRGGASYIPLPVNLTTEDGEFITDELTELTYVRIVEANYKQGRTQNLYPEHENRLANDTNKIYTNDEYRLYLSKRS